MIRTDKKPKDHYEGRWEKGKKYSLFAVVDNNGTKFRSVTAKPKPEPYVSYDSETGEFYANEGWVIAEMSEDSRISALGGNGGGGGGSSSGSMGEDEEYTIAQALNDLNDRIKELQEQTAQQDYINIHVSSSLDAPSDFATEVFPILEEKMKQGCLLDCVLVDVDSTQFAKILTYETVDGNLYQVDYMYGGETRYIRADLE